MNAFLPRLSLLLIVGLISGLVACARADVESVEFGGKEFRVYRLDPAKQRLDLVWKGADGQPYKNFRKVEAALNAQGKRLKLAMNAGIYGPGIIPDGLHVENGKTLVALNLADGDGNFFLKPNGVFFIDEAGKPAVMEASAYAVAGKKPRLAVQSGPVLLIDAKIHPAFNEGSANVRYRNGIGVDAEGRIVMAISVMKEGNATNFHNFARLFRDQLGCQNALYLDGDISELYVRAADGDEVPPEQNWFAAMFVVTEPLEGADDK